MRVVRGTLCYPLGERRARSDEEIFAVISFPSLRETLRGPVIGFLLLLGMCIGCVFRVGILVGLRGEVFELAGMFSLGDFFRYSPRDVLRPVDVYFPRSFIEDLCCEFAVLPISDPHRTHADTRLLRCSTMLIACIYIRLLS